MTTTQNQNDNTMKTTIISLGSGSGQVLKAIRENNIKHSYVGIDQSNQIVLQLTYTAAHESLIEDISRYMKQFAQLEQEWTAAFEIATKKQQEEELLTFRKLKYDYKMRKTKKQPIKELSELNNNISCDGNQQGK